ncbi:MAG: branched-chain amino acid ABC transporter permease [Desulfobacula sp.]|jgi:branched-chain amino acid transport system permease protein|nr:branched-chain amino acid ABC transporter permease [Desulfobacula sp.]
MTEQKGFPTIAKTQAVIYLAVIVVLAILPIFIKSPYTYHIFILTFVYIIATSSLRTLAISGQVSMAHAGFMSIGAYTSAVLARYLGWSPWLSMPVGALATMLVAVLVGFPFSRVRAIYFSMVSLFFGIGILSINSIFGKYTGHINGMIGIPPLFVGSRMQYYFFFLGLMVFCLIILWRFETCRIGICLKAIDQSHEVAASVGISETKFRVLAMGVSCFVVGLAGAAYAHYNMVISYSSFNLIASIDMLVYMLIGGIGSFAGPIIGTAVLFIIPELFRQLKEYTPFLYAGILLLVVFVMPNGLVGLMDQIRDLVKKEK